MMSDSNKKTAIEWFEIYYLDNNTQVYDFGSVNLLHSWNKELLTEEEFFTRMHNHTMIIKKYVK